MRFVFRPLVVAVVLLVSATGCSSSGHAKTGPSGNSSSAGATDLANSGIKVGGGFGAKPELTIPAGAAPGKLLDEVLTQGTGATVVKGDTLIANYLGQTWAPKSGKPNVFDSSFSRGTPAPFVIGVGSVIPGWDKTLVGQKIGSRLLLSVPPADGYGTNGQASANIAGTDTLVFVVDVLATYKPNASAPGKPIATLPTKGFPKISNPIGKAPSILSTAGVKAPSKPVSTLVATGTGATIDKAKSLVLQIVQSDIATGKATQSSWGKAPQVVGAKNVLTIASALTGQKVGSRVVVLAPALAPTPATASQQAQAGSPAQVLIVDVVGQF